MKSFIIIILCCLTTSCFAQTHIKMEDAKNHEGDSVKICDKIFTGKYLAQTKEPITLLDFGGNYPNQPLTLVIHDSIRKLFKKPPEEYFKGASVCVTGTIKIFKDKPEIIINDPDQIKEVIFDQLKVVEPE